MSSNEVNCIDVITLLTNSNMKRLDCCMPIETIVTRPNMDLSKFVMRSTVCRGDRSAHGLANMNHNVNDIAGD